jgi:hypothetical protein
MGWFTGVNWMQKNASFKSKHEKQLAWNHQVQSHCCMIEHLEIVHWVVIIGAWLWTGNTGVFQADWQGLDIS